MASCIPVFLSSACQDVVFPITDCFEDEVEGLGHTEWSFGVRIFRLQFGDFGDLELLDHRRSCVHRDWLIRELLLVIVLLLEDACLILHDCRFLDPLVQVHFDAIFVINIFKDQPILIFIMFSFIAVVVETDAVEDELVALIHRLLLIQQSGGRFTV